jgi:hypothetical protein
MRIGISWDLGELHDDTQTAWRTAVAEAGSAARHG